MGCIPRRRHCCPSYTSHESLQRMSPPPPLSPSVESLSFEGQPSPCPSSAESLQLQGEHTTEVAAPEPSGKFAAAYTYLLEILQYAFGCIHDLAGFFQSKNVKTEITFGKLHEYLKTVPGILSCIHVRLTNHFQYPVESITLLLEGLQEFVLNPDIADASIGDFNSFAQSSYDDPIVPILHHVTWIEELLCQFKRFVSELWVKMKKISSPCQFGAKSDKLYLCMECMTEHF